MKKIIFALVAVLSCISAEAQLRYGFNLGGEFSSPYSGGGDGSPAVEGGSGFTGGLQLEYQVPTNGVAFGVSLMYARRNVWLSPAFDPSQGPVNSCKYGGDFLVLPLELKYKFPLSLTKDLVSPYLLTGPDFALRMNKAEGKNFHFGWDVGAGIDLINVLQISGGYRFGVNDIGNGIKDSGAFLNVGLLFDF